MVAASFFVRWAVGRHAVGDLLRQRNARPQLTTGRRPGVLFGRRLIGLGTMIRRALPLLALLAFGCTDARDRDEGIVVSFAGAVPDIADPGSSPPGPAAALLLEGTAQGLVALDAEGQVEPALARRWILLDDGLSYIFRLENVTWDDGETLTARQIVRRFEEARRQGGRNRLGHLLGEIDAINAVTPEILEITLRHPHPDFLQLLAQPDLAIMREGAGLGPLEIAEAQRGRMLLRPRPDPADDDPGENGDQTAPPTGADSDHEIVLRFEPMSRAVARFELGMSDLVLGGSWLDIFYAEAIEPATDQLVLDPVQGLFGLGFVEESGFLGEPANRDLLAMAIDRERIVAGFARIEAEVQLTIVPAGASGLDRLSSPDWIDAGLARRRAFAANRVARWIETNGEIAPIRIALADLPGSRCLFAAIRASWRAIGIDAVRAPIDADADLRLIDRVAPSDSAEWYLTQFRCGKGFPCSEELDAALDAADAAATSEDRIRSLAEAEAMLTQLVPFIPLMRPIRWSLISSRITNFHPNRYASHPLDTLIAERR